MQSKFEKNGGNTQLRGQEKAKSRKGKESWRNGFNKSTIQDFLFIRSLIFLSLSVTQTHTSEVRLFLPEAPSYFEQKLVKENCSFNQKDNDAAL